MFKFITNRPFWVNLLVALALNIIIIFSLLELLGVITHHGQYIKIPSVGGMNTKDAVKLLEEKGFNVVVDSVYTDTARKGIVLKQFPEASNLVKVNRTVFLTVNKNILPDIEMPNLEGKTITYVLEILKRSHFQLGDTTYRTDFMKGTILEQKMNGKRLAAGAKIPWGSRIDLIIGSGLGEESILVPDLVGLTFGEAKTILDQNGIILGAAITDPGVVDTASAFVWKQVPPRFNDDKQPLYIRQGQLMDLWITLDLANRVDSSKIKQ